MQLVYLLNFLGLFAYASWLRNARPASEIMKKPFIRRPHVRA